MAIPIKDEPLASWSTNANTRLIADGVTVYLLTAPQVAGYTPLHTAFITAFNALKAARESGTDSQQLTADKNDAKQALLEYAREIYGFVQVNRSVSDGDKILLGVTVRDTDPSPIPPPATAPQLTVVSVNGHIVEVRLRDAADPDRKALPDGVDGAIVLSHVGETAPSNPLDFSMQGPVGKTNGTVIFPEEIAPGTKVWLCAVWFNGRKEMGPACSPVSAHIGFDGAMSMAA